MQDLLRPPYGHKQNNNNPYTEYISISFTPSASILTDCFCRDPYKSKKKKKAFFFLSLSFYIHGVRCTSYICICDSLF